MSAAVSPAFAGKAKHKASSEAIYEQHHILVSIATGDDGYVEKQNGKWMYCTKGKGCVSEKEYAKGKLPGDEKAPRKPETNQELEEQFHKHFGWPKPKRNAR